MALEEAPCPLLRLPVELRLQIYAHTLLSSTALTISSAELTGAHPDIIHRLYGNQRVPYPGLPRNHEPVVAQRYDPTLLSTTNPPSIPAKSPITPQSDYPRCEPLYLLNKQIHHELRTHFPRARERNKSLFVAYPSGLHVLQTLVPSLLHQTRSLHLAGIYKPDTFNASRRAVLPNIQGKQSSAHYNDYVLDSATQLADLIKSMFGPEARHSVAKLELRIYYPGEDSYSTVWGDDRSPIVLALRNIYIGDIGITCYRGQYGTGVYLSSRSNEERRRVVSTVWRKLEEGRRGEPACGSWVVDGRWPEWEDEAAQGKGDAVLTSSGAES